MQSTPPRTLRRKALVASALSFGLALGLGELLVRRVTGSPLPEHLPVLQVVPHATRGWAMLPAERHYTYAFPVEVNSLGLRGPELGPKGDRELRLLALGDSMVYGQGVAEDGTLPACIARQVGPHWSVINAGHRAYATHQHLALLDELGTQLAPDVVVLFWYWNDLQEQDVKATFARLQAEAGPVAFDTGERIEGLSKVLWHGRQLLRRSALLMLSYDALTSPWRHEAPPAAERERGFERLRLHMGRFVAGCEALGAEARFAVIPDARGVLDEAHFTRTLERRAEETARAAGVPVLSLQRAFEGHDVLPLVPFDGHYDGQGNALLARRLVAGLRELR